MAELSGKIVGKLVISSDIVATADDVQQYVVDSGSELSGNVMSRVSDISSDLKDLIDNLSSTAIDGYVPLSALENEVLKIIRENYTKVADILDGSEDNTATIDGGNSK